MSKICNFTKEDIEKKLLDKGVQPTLQRIALCQYLLCNADHPTAEQVFNWAQENLHKISQATVYNTLGTLTEVGLVRTFRFPHSDKVVYDCNTQDHFHFFDEKTGQLHDVDPSSVDVNFSLPNKYKINGFDLVFKGEVKQTTVGHRPTKKE
ncbi:MAG: Fur family transcriptional regulator [Bdellovibrionales bacterium]